MTLPSTGSAGADGLPDAKAGTPTVAIAAHANHGKYFFLNPIPGLSPSDGPRLRPKITRRQRTSQRLLHMRGAKASMCSSYDRSRFDLDLGGGLDEPGDLDDRHRREVAAHHVAVGGADLLQAREVLLTRGHVPGQPRDVLGPGAGLGEHRDDVAQRLTDPPGEVLGRDLAVLVPADLAADEHELARGLDAVRVAAR